VGFCFRVFYILTETSTTGILGGHEGGVQGWSQLFILCFTFIGTSLPLLWGYFWQYFWSFTISTGAVQLLAIC